MIACGMSYKNAADYVKLEIIEHFRTKKATGSRVLTVSNLQIILSEWLMAAAEDFQVRMNTHADSLNYPTPSQEHGTWCRPHSFALKVPDGPPKEDSTHGDFYGNNLMWPAAFGALAYEYYPEIQWSVAMYKGFMPSDSRTQSSAHLAWVKEYEAGLSKRNASWIKFLDTLCRVAEKTSTANRDAQFATSTRDRSNLGVARGWNDPSVQEQLNIYHIGETIGGVKKFVEVSNKVGDEVEGAALARALLMEQAFFSVKIFRLLCVGISKAIPAMIAALAIRTQDSAKRQRTRKTSRRNS